MATRRLGLVVSKAADIDVAVALALRARERSIDVDMFLMDEAVAAASRRRAEIERLADVGCEVIACAQSAMDRGLSEADVGVYLGSQDDHAAIAGRVDRLVAFT